MGFFGKLDIEVNEKICYELEKIEKDIKEKYGIILSIKYDWNIVGYIENSVEESSKKQE